VDVGEGGELEDESLGRAGEPRERRRKHEGKELVLLGPISERDRPRLVFADGLQHLTERRWIAR